MRPMCPEREAKMSKEDKLKRLCQSDSQVSSQKEHKRVLRRLQKSADDYILWYEVQRFEAEYAKRHKRDDQQ